MDDLTGSGGAGGERSLLAYLPGFERHLQVLQALAQASVYVYRRKVEEFHAWCLGNAVSVDPGAISRQDIEAYLEWCYYRGNVNHTRFTKLIAVQKFFRYLVYERVIQEDPTVGIPKPRVHRKFVQKFTREEVLRLFTAMDPRTEKGLRDVVILIFAVFCGMRVSEIVNLNLNDIVDDGNIDINITGTKHGGSRSVYLWKAPSLVIRQWLTIRLNQGARGNDPFLVTYSRGGVLKGRRLNATVINQGIKRYAKAAGIRKPEIHVHMFRATHASDLRQVQGYDIAAIAERLGHKHIASTDVYFPQRGRVHRTYPSLAAYWKEWTHLWKEGKQHDHTGDGGGNNAQQVRQP